MVVGEVGEDEPVVPVASGLLEGLEGCGQLVGAAGGFGGGFGDVAGQLGGLADGVELVGIVWVGFGGELSGEPVLGEVGELGCGQGEAFGWGEGLEEGLDGLGQFGLVAVEGLDQVGLGLGALALQGLAELAGFLLG